MGLQSQRLQHLASKPCLASFITKLAVITMEKMMKANHQQSMRTMAKKMKIQRVNSQTMTQTTTIAVTACISSNSNTTSRLIPRSTMRANMHMESKRLSTSRSTMDLGTTTVILCLPNLCNKQRLLTITTMDTWAHPTIDLDH